MYKVWSCLCEHETAVFKLRNGCLTIPHTFIQYRNKYPKYTCIINNYTVNCT